MIKRLQVHSSFATVYAALREARNISIELTGAERGVLHLRTGLGLIHALDGGVGIAMLEFDDEKDFDHILTVLDNAGLRVDHVGA